MAKRPDPTQPIYVISIAAELAGVHPQTLRVYERKGLVSPKRTSGNSRRYSERDIELLRRIQELTNEGINLAGVMRILELEAEVERLRTPVPDPEPSAPVCTACPVCALLAVLRGERSDLVVRLAEQAGGLLTALRAALEAAADAPDVPQPDAPAPGERTASGSPRPVQRITVQRAAGSARGC